MTLFSLPEFGVPIKAVALIEGEVVELLEKAHQNLKLYDSKKSNKTKTKSLNRKIVAGGSLSVTRLPQCTVHSTFCAILFLPHPRTQWTPRLGAMECSKLKNYPRSGRAKRNEHAQNFVNFLNYVSTVKIHSGQNEKCNQLFKIRAFYNIIRVHDSDNRETGEAKWSAARASSGLLAGARARKYHRHRCHSPEENI